MSYQALLGKFSISTSSDTFNIGTDQLALDLNTYYIQGYTGETDDQLCQHMQNTIQAGNIGQGNANVTFHTSNGYIGIYLNAAQNITFVDSALGTILGFTSDSSNATSHMADQQPRYVWWPDREPTDHPVDLNVFWVPRSTSRVGRSKDGTTFSTEGVKLYDAYLEYMYLDKNISTTPATGTIYADFQQFFEVVL